MPEINDGFYRRVDFAMHFSDRSFSDGGYAAFVHGGDFSFSGGSPTSYGMGIYYSSVGDEWVLFAHRSGPGIQTLPLGSSTLPESGQHEVTIIYTGHVSAGGSGEVYLYVDGSLVGLMLNNPAGNLLNGGNDPFFSVEVGKYASGNFDSSFNLYCSSVRVTLIDPAYAPTHGATL